MEEIAWYLADDNNELIGFMYKHFFKQSFDLIISLIALICIGPILLVVTILLYFANKGVKTVQPLNLIPLSKQQMIDTLANEYGYVSYGQKHFEDEITKFVEGYWEPKRYGHDIRMAWNSSLIMSG